MKMLINELQKHLDSLTIPSDRFGRGWHTGFVQALQIVRRHNPWMPVSELPPSRDEKGNYIEYLFKFDDTNDMYIAFHDGEERWYESYDESFLMIGKYGAKWTYLPEVNNGK